MSSEVHFVSCNITTFDTSAMIKSRSSFYLLRLLRPLMFQDMIFMMTEGGGEGGSYLRSDESALNLP